MSDPKVVQVYRPLKNGARYHLGSAIYYQSYNGWRFIPNVCGRSASRKFWPTWEASLPRWVGYPDKCETVAIAQEDKR